MRNRKGVLTMLTGLLLIVAALLLMLYNMREEEAAGSASATVMAEMAALRAMPSPAPVLQTPPTPETTGVIATEVPGIAATEAPPEYVLHPEMQMPTTDIEGERYVGTLEIPVLELTLPVISEWSYPRLKKSPCRFSGSAYMDDLIIIAHNYKTHFGMIKTLLPGDEVLFTDMEGHAFRYVVAETEVLQPQQIEELTGTDYALTLLTCTIGGRTRVTVRCDRVAE